MRSLDKTLGNDDVEDSSRDVDVDGDVFDEVFDVDVFVWRMHVAWVLWPLSAESDGVRRFFGIGASADGERFGKEFVGAFLVVAFCYLLMVLERSLTRGSKR